MCHLLIYSSRHRGCFHSLAIVNIEHSEVLASEVPSLRGWRDVSKEVGGIVKLEAKQACREVLLDVLTSPVQEVTTIMQTPHHFLVSFSGKEKAQCGEEGDKK